MRGDAGEQAKDGSLCLHCGGPKPASLGTKPRKFCSSACCGAATRLRSRPSQPWPPICVDCGEVAGQSRRAGRRRLRCGKCRASHERTANRDRLARHTNTASCEACGNTFSFPGYTRRKRFCSDGCRFSLAKSGKNARPVPCPRCGTKFVKKRADQAYCSTQCRARVFSCLNCQSQFKPRNTRHAKYCSRECAFDARRRRLPAAIADRRDCGVAARLARWFWSWGDDVFPYFSRCGDCGELVLIKNAEHNPQCAVCLRRRTRRRLCRDCGNDLCGGGHARIKRMTCSACREKRRMESRRLARKKNGKNHRQRCRKYGAPYTKIRELAVYERDNWTCQICGRTLRKDWDCNDPSCRTIDHIIPLSLGPLGPGHVLSNVRACCHGCNSRKSDSIEPGALQTLH